MHGKYFIIVSGACVCVCVCQPVSKKQLSTVLPCFLCHVSFPRCCNSVIVQGVLQVYVCVFLSVLNKCEFFSAVHLYHVAVKHKLMVELSGDKEKMVAYTVFFKTLKKA